MRKIKQKNFFLVQQELHFLREVGKITPQQYQEILEQYDVRSINFIQVLVTVGALLLGFGILAFVASNWHHLGAIWKLLLVLFLVGVFNYSGYFLKEKYPRASTGLLYTGSLSYGAGLFLIAQMFNFTLNMPYLFLLWFIGITPLAFYLKDSVLMGLSQLLLLIYLGNYYLASDMLPFLGIAIFLSVIFLDKKIFQSKIVAIFNVLQGLLVLLMFCHEVFAEPLISTLLIFAMGFFLIHIKDAIGVYEPLGNLLTGAAGLLLTFEFMWEFSGIMKGNGDMMDHFVDLTVVMWLFIAVYVCYLFYSIKKGNLYSIVILVGIILRFYIDITYDFLPKSLFFIVGGAILLSFGAYFEKQRRENPDNGS